LECQKRLRHGDLLTLLQSNTSLDNGSNTNIRTDSTAEQIH
jgi:hypothetical protein